MKSFEDRVRLTTVDLCCSFNEAMDLINNAVYNQDELEGKTRDEIFDYMIYELPARLHNARRKKEEEIRLKELSYGIMLNSTFGKILEPWSNIINA